MADVRASGCKERKMYNLILFNRYFIQTLNAFCVTFSILHSHDDSDDVIRMVSFGFCLLAMPVNAGMRMVEKPSNILLLRMIEFFMIATMIWTGRKDYVKRLLVALKANELLTWGVTRRAALIVWIGAVSSLRMDSTGTTAFSVIFNSIPINFSNIQRTMFTRFEMNLNIWRP